MGFSRQEYLRGLPFPSPGDHILSELSTMTCVSWVALHVMAHSFIELDKAVVSVISVVSFLRLWFFSLSALWWIRLRGFWKLPDGRDWLRGKLGLVLMGEAMLSKSLIQFSVDGWGKNNHREVTNLITWPQHCLTQWDYDLCHVGPPKTDRSCWGVLTIRGPLEKGIANHFNVLAIRTPWTVWKAKDMTLKDELPRSVGALYATGEE